MRKKVLHIGLGKCGSTYLQKIIFPEIEKKLQIRNIKVSEIINPNQISSGNHILKNITNLEKQLPDNFIFSYEGLYSENWEFSRILKSFNYIKNNFSQDTIILIIVRNPYNLLNSIFTQSIMEMNITDPNKFFYLDENQINIKNNKFNLHKFDYNYLVSLYKSFFKNVEVVKYEEINNFKYLKKIFNLDDEFLKHLSTKKNAIINPSISKLGIKTFILLNKFIDLKNNQKKIKDFLKKPSSKVFYKIKWKLFAFLQLKEFFQYTLDKKLKPKKYFINKSYIPIDIEQMVEEYECTKF